jgi:hypothetical protein
LPVYAVLFGEVMGVSTLSKYFNIWSLITHIHYVAKANTLNIQVFNKLPPYIKDEFENIRKFKRRLKNFLHEKSFYSLQEYFDLKN